MPRRYGHGGKHLRKRRDSANFSRSFGRILKNLESRPIREHHRCVIREQATAEWPKPGNETMPRQEDVDAQWAKKNGGNHYGYKNHVKVDRKTKLIKKAVVTDASVHDSQALPDLVDKADACTTIHADSAYSGEEQLDEIMAQSAIPKVCEKGYRNKPLTKAQMKRNRSLSRKRERAEANIILKNLAYNMKRYRVLVTT